METVEKYLDEVCSYITNVPYRRAVRRELESHMEEAIDAAMADGATRQEAVYRAVSQMGDARETGCRLDRQFSVRPDYRLVLYILGIFLLHTAASVNIQFSPAEAFLTFFSLGGCVLLFPALKRFDLEGNYYLIKYLYFGTLLLLALTYIFADPKVQRNCASIAGVILTFCVIFFIYRLHRSSTWGLAAAMLLFLLPASLLLLSAAYAAFLLYTAAGIFTLACFLWKGWQCREWVKGAFPVLCAGILGAAILTGSSALLRKLTLWDGFFLQSKADHTAYLAEHFGTYPLAACISRYGYGALAVYVLFISLILFEIMWMKKKIHTFLGRNVLNCVFLILSVKSVLAVLLNLGFPFTGAFMLPFAGMGADQISNLLLVFLAEYVYCFGNAMFAEHSFYAEHKLLEVDRDRIILFSRFSVSDRE